jgi:hypothetical protein
MIRSFPSIPIVPSPDAILGQLYPPGQTPTERQACANELATQAAGRARELIQAAGVFRIIPAEELAPWPPTARGEFLVAGLASLGFDLDAACQNLRAEGQDTRALFLDAAGAVAVEAACDFLEKTIARECRRQMWNRTRRASPGYGAFPLEDQKRLFELLPAGDLGVELTAECMMTPLKSVSFVILAGENPQLVRADLTCDACALLNCPDHSSSRPCRYRENHP